MEGTPTAVYEAQVRLDGGVTVALAMKARSEFVFARLAKLPNRLKACHVSLFFPVTAPELLLQRLLQTWRREEEKAGERVRERYFGLRKREKLHP